MRLLPREAFAEVFEPLAGRRVAYVRSIGNAGDALIDWGTLQMFGEFGINYCEQDPASPIGADRDVIVFAGGGNMGTRYRHNWELRGRLLSQGLPVVVFPQTFFSPEDRPYERVYVRERASWRYCPGAILAPDLALGLQYTNSTSPTCGTGLFLRRDCERTSKWRWFLRDPARMCRTPQAYLQLAARYERIITNQLHFAICGLILGRETTLLPNDNHKNQAMYETWLKSFGCRFAPNLRVARRQRRAA